MSEIHPAIKLVILEIIRRLFKGGEILTRTLAIELNLASSGSNTAPDFKFQVYEWKKKFSKITSTKSVKYICQSRIEENF